MQTVYVLSGPPGSGKSHRMRETAVSTPGLYLVATPTIRLAEEQRHDYAKASSIPLFPVHSENGQAGSVARQFENVRCEIADRGLDHAAVFITHESLLTLNLGELDGWRALIDEVPHAVRSDAFNVPVSGDFFASRFDLEPWPGTGWSVVSPSGPSVPWHVAKADSIASGLAEFEQEARRPHGVIVNVESWDQAADRGRLEWLSIWTPKSLAHFTSVTIAGAGLFTSLAYRAAVGLFPDDLTFKRVPVLARPRAGCPTLRLHYYVEGHRGSTTFWGTPQGRQVLAPIRRHLAAVPDLGYWSGNEAVRALFDTELRPDTYVAPKVAGSNRYMQHRSCAFIYSAQAVPSDKPLQLFGLDKRAIEEAREAEDLYQFVMRGRLRDPAFSGAFDAYVYSRAQAEEIARRATEDGVAAVELVAHPEVGVMDVTRGKPKAIRSPEEIEARRQADRIKDAARKQAARQKAAKAAGRTGKPGRPRKRPPPE